MKYRRRMDVDIVINPHGSVCDALACGEFISGRRPLVNQVFADSNLINEPGSQKLLEHLELCSVSAQCKRTQTEYRPEGHLAA